MTTVTFEQWLIGRGWAKAYLQIGPATVELSASYLDDALGDLVRATADIATGAQQVRVSWTEEPGEFRWVLAVRGNILDVTVLWFDQMWSDREDEKSRQLLHESCPKRSFCEAVADGAQRVHDQYGLAGYREEWAAHDFPVDALLALRAAL